MASPTSINKLQVMQNSALRACTGCTHDTNIKHLHDETNILPIQKHLQLRASQVRQKAQYPSHPLHRYITHNTSQLLKKPTTFNNSRYTTNIPTDPCTVTTAGIKTNMRDIHTSIVSQHLAARDNNKIFRTHLLQVSSSGKNLPRHTRRTLAQLRKINPRSSYHIYTKSTLQYTHQNSAPLVAFMNILYNISSVAHRYAPRCRPWICGGILPA